MTYATPADLLAETSSLSGIVQAGPYRYEVTTQSDYHVETTGGDKLYALPDASGWITSEQLGWSDSDDVTTDLSRFWSRFSEGDKFLLCHNVNLGNARLVMPDNFTLQAQKVKVDGFHFSDSTFSGSTGLFGLGDNCTVRGVSFTATLSGSTTGTIFDGGTAGVAESLVDAVFDNCKFDVRINRLMLIRESKRLVINRCDILDGYWKINLIGGDGLTFTRNYCTAGLYPNSEVIKLGKSTLGPFTNAFVAFNTFYETHRDGMDTTGGLQHSVFYRNRFIRCGWGPGGVGGVGFGGLDFKTTQTDRLAPIFPNQDIWVIENYFEDSHCSSVANWNDDWTDPTDAEIYEYSSHNIHLRDNTFNKAGGGGASVKCGIGLAGGAFTLDGDKFEGGAAWWGVANAMSVRGTNLVVETKKLGGGDPSIQDGKNISLHFKEFRIPGGGVDTVNVLNCRNVSFSGHILAHGGAGDTIFAVSNNGDATENIRFSFSGEYVGSTYGPMLVDFDKALGSGMDNFFIEGCHLSGFSQLCRVRGGSNQPALPLLIVRGNTWLGGEKAMVDFRTLSNTAKVTTALLTGNLGDRATALCEGDTSGVQSLITNDNYGFSA
jgi:hypothetical protein